MSIGSVVLFPLTLASSVFVRPQTIPRLAGSLRPRQSGQPSSRRRAGAYRRPPRRGADRLGAARIRGTGRGIRARYSPPLRQETLTGILQPARNLADLAAE